MGRILDPSLPKDQEEAKTLLATLAEKDKDETQCFYPTCEDPRRPYDGNGQPPKYCTSHNARMSYDARRYLRGLANGLSEEVAGRERLLPTKVTTEIQGTALIDAIQHLEHLLIQIRTEAHEWSDPTFLDARIETIQAQADARVADAQEKERSEHERRIAAERAKEAALRTVESAQEAADLAIKQNEETENRIQQLREELILQLAEKQTTCDLEIATFRDEMEREIERAQKQADTRVLEAQAGTQKAQEEASQAKDQARKAEDQARIEIASAERLVQNMEEDRNRERREVLRLREECDGLTQRLNDERKEARVILETVQKELRLELTEVRKERHDMQGELKIEKEARQQAEKRSDTLAIQADALRDKLAVWIQAAQHPSISHDPKDSG